MADEAIHLTTAFQLAGYPHMVGTDTRGAAQALHQAVRAIRDELPAIPSLWAAYLHAGA